MPRQLSKLKRKFKRVQKKLGPILPVVLTALLGAFLLWGAGTLFDLFGFVPAISVNGIVSGTTYATVTAETVTAIVGFLLGLVAGGWYFAYRPNRETVQEHWERVPTWMQATTVGLVGALVVTGGLLAVRAAVGLSALAVLAGFLLTWPAGTGAMIVRQRSIDDTSRKTAMRVGYTHAKGLESRTISIIMGSLVGVTGGLLTWYISVSVGNWDTALPAVTVALLLWVGLTIAMYDRYDQQTAEQSDLSIVEVNRPETRETWELHIKNESTETVDLSLAKVRDTKFDLYKFGVDTDLGPGETCTFNAPAEFRLAPNDDSWELPLGYTLNQGSETPAILTRDGEMYGLQRDRLDDPVQTGEGTETSVSHGGQTTPSGSTTTQD